MAIAQTDLDALRGLTPDVLRFYGINPAQSFRIPWRDDSRASGYYSDKSNLVTDYGKDERFNVFQFVGRMENIERFPDQVRRVAEIANYGDLHDDGSPSPTSRPPRAERPRFEPPAKAGMPETALLPFAGYMGDLLQNDMALEYLHGRGFTDEKLFQNVIGYVEKPTDVSDAFTLYEPNRPRGYIVIPFPVDETFCTVNYCMLRAIPGDKLPEHKEMRPTGYKSTLYREWLLSARCSVLYVTEGLLDCLALEMLIHKPCMALGGSVTARMGQLLYYMPAER